MSLGSSIMAGTVLSRSSIMAGTVLSRSSIMYWTVLGAAFSLLFFTSFVQGLQDVEVSHCEMKEAVVGQNIALPCVVENQPGLNMLQIEWSIKDMNSTKLVVHNSVFGTRLLRPNVSIEIKNNDGKKLIGSYLQLQGVEKRDSGIYICDITAFPVGSIRRETELKVKDVDTIKCDMNSTFEVNAGENVIIHCRADMFTDSQFRWTKDKKVVSESKSLKLWWVSDAQAGVYTLTVSAGNSSLHTEFIITVLTATTSLGTGLMTMPPQSNVSEEGLVQTRTPADINHTTSPTIGQPSMGTSVTWNVVIDTNVTADNTKPHDVTTSDGKPATSLGTFPSFTNSLNISVTSPPATHSHTDRLHNSTDLTVTTTEMVRQEFNPTNNLTTTPITDQASIYPEDSSLTRAEESSTLGTAKMNSENPGVSSTLSTGENTVVIIETDTGGGRSYLLLIFFPVLALIALVAILCRRHIIKKRMGLPPPFKPPPPPVKYSAVRLHEIPTTVTS